MDYAELVAAVFGKRQRAVAAGCDAVRAAAARGHAELRDHKSACGDLADLVGAGLREPEIAVRASRDADRAAAVCGNRELIRSRDGPGRGDPADLVGGGPP